MVMIENIGQLEVEVVVKEVEEVVTEVEVVQIEAEEVLIEDHLKEAAERSLMKIHGNGSIKMPREKSSNHSGISKLMQTQRLTQCP